MRDNVYRGVAQESLGDCGLSFLAGLVALAPLAELFGIGKETETDRAWKARLEDQEQLTPHEVRLYRQNRQTMRRLEAKEQTLEGLTHAEHLALYRDLPYPPWVRRFNAKHPHLPPMATYYEADL